MPATKYMYIHGSMHNEQAAPPPLPPPKTTLAYYRMILVAGWNCMVYVYKGRWMTKKNGVSK